MKFCFDPSLRINYDIVIGAGFGDEGKGHVVDWLSEKNNVDTTVRFSGGPQAAHNVIRDGKQHVFSHFGSSLIDKRHTTIWSEDCFVNLESLHTEWKILSKKKNPPFISIHENCKLITPYDQWACEKDSNNIRHGSTGHGIFKTFDRNNKGYTLFYKDIFNESIFNIKLDLIREYYKFPKQDGWQKPVDKYVDKSLAAAYNITNKYTDTCLVKNNSIVIFEGSQGLLLDQNYGFFPHVTPSNCGTTNIPEEVLKYSEIYLVTRAYHTRHGNGPIGSIEDNSFIRDNPYEQNYNVPPQGNFRKNILNLDLLKYAVQSDKVLRNRKINLVITCLDLLDEFKYVKNNQIYNCKDLNTFINTIRCSFEQIPKKVYISFGPEAKDIQEYI